MPKGSLALWFTTVYNKFMCWEAITAVATSATVISVVGVALMQWVWSRPKVKLISCHPIGWFCTYINGEKIDNIRLVIEIKMRNEGSDKTVVDFDFTTDKGEVFISDNNIELERVSKIITNHICLDKKCDDYKQYKGQLIRGKLKLTPLGHKRLFWGKKYLYENLTIPENQAQAGKEIY